jgi:hypothetical protein
VPFIGLFRVTHHVQNCSATTVQGTQQGWQHEGKETRKADRFDSRMGLRRTCRRRWGGVEGWHAVVNTVTNFSVLASFLAN